MRSILAAQLLVPVALIGWMVVSPARSVLGFWGQVLASLLVLAALAIAGIWLFPPWWVPLAAAMAILVAAAWHLRRHSRVRPLPAGLAGWAGLGLSLTGGALCGALVIQARLGAMMPTSPTVSELAFPFDSGRFLVVNGGNTLLINAHRRSMDVTITRLQPWRGNAHAVDLVAIDRWGLRASSGIQPVRPSAYHIFGLPVTAPCGGTVVAAVDGLPDMPVPDYDRAHPAGNHVILDCNGIHVILGHLREGSLLVQERTLVAPGTVLGQVGNSGGTDEPHLHIHAQRPGRPGATMSGDPLPIRLGGRYLVRGDRVNVAPPSH